MGPITYTFEELVALKNSGKVPEVVIEKLKADADSFIQKPTLKVTDIKLPRPSGDPHDYVSIAPYRWPNPDTKDGLPWIPRDGYVNPDTQHEMHPGIMYGRIRILGLAALYIPERAKDYAEYANRQMYDWFINPETRINPNAKYSQALPGICEGRSAGLIAFSTSYALFNGIGILECLELMDNEILVGVKAWFVEFANWILTSDEYGLRTDTGVGNHPSWLSANLIATAAFTGRQTLLKQIATTAHHRRIKAFIEPDGSQPEELKRATAMGYSFYSLHAMFVFSNIAERNGYPECWSIDSERGECILKRAVDFLYPYVIDPDSFPYQELHKGKHRSRMARAMLTVAKRYPDKEYEARALELISEPEEWMLEPLF